MKLIQIYFSKNFLRKGIPGGIFKKSLRLIKTLEEFTSKSLKEFPEDSLEESPKVYF